MENYQQSHAYSEADHHTTPNPVACHPCLILFSHTASLLPALPQSKEQMPESGRASYFGIACRELSRDAFADVCRASVSDANRKIAFHRNALQLTRP